MKKHLFLLFFFLFVVGCSPEHRLIIKGDTITEVINFTVDREMFVLENEYDEQYSDIFSPAMLNYILNDNVSVFSNGPEIYEKTVSGSGRFTDVELRHTYEQHTFPNAMSINDCFENVDVRTKGNQISISLSGEYLCLFDENSTINFVVDTTNKVKSHNSELFTWDNYNWTINSGNKENVNIEIVLWKQSVYVYYGIRIALLIVAFIVMGYVIKIKTRSSLNEV